MESSIKHPPSSNLQRSSKLGTKEVAKLLRQCSNLKALERGKSIHEQISQVGQDRDTYLGNLLVDMYGKCGQLQEARQAFDQIHKKNVFSWNILLAANALNGSVNEAVQLMWEMHQSGIKADKFTFTTMIQTFMKSADFSEAKKLHFCIQSSGIRLDVVGYTELIRLYGRFRSMENAKQVFEEMSDRDAFAWTAMVSAYVQCGLYNQSLDLFRVMREPDKVAFIAAIDACGQARDLRTGTIIHERLRSARLNVDSVLSNALISMYGRCSSLDQAYKVFDSITTKTVVSWTAIIGACVQNGECVLAVEMFDEMEASNIEPNERTYVNVLEACSSLADMRKGEALHQRIKSSGMEPDEELETALMSMYGRCGSVERARDLFESMKQRDVIAWSSMIAAYSGNSSPLQALKLFYRMQAEGVKPNRVTFVSVLSACASAGLLEEACWQFNSLIGERKIVASIEHYVCLIDVIGKSGWLQTAYDFMRQMGIENQPAAWVSLLAACKMQGEEVLALYCAQRLAQLGFHDHVALSLHQSKIKT